MNGVTVTTRVKTEIFYVTCIRCHVCEVRPGTALYEVCLKRLQDHPERIGAMVISGEDCLGCCIERSRSRSEYVHNYWDWEYCVKHDQHGSKCPENCTSHVKWPEEITFGQYDGQMKWLQND
jgi:hypothetical protein